jgi:hypothetical protein
MTAVLCGIATFIILYEWAGLLACLRGAKERRVQQIDHIRRSSILLIILWREHQVDLPQPRKEIL